jgi:hypothetical protein
MIRYNLESNVNSALILKGTWVFDPNNDFELFKNKLSVEFINWRNFLPSIWRINTIDVETNEDVSLMLEVNSIEIFVIDRSLISNIGNRKNTIKQKIKATHIPVNLITQDNTSAVTVKVFNKTISTNNFCEINFALTKSNPFPSYRDRVEVLDSKYEDKETIKKLNAKIRNKISERSIEDDKFFYALRVDIIFSRLENFGDDIVELNSGDDTFFKLLENSANRLFT